MRTRLTIAFAAATAFALSPAVLAQSKDASVKTEQKKSGLASKDRKYFRDIAEANMAEVQTGKVAQQKASSDEVKKFAQHMVDDHGKMLEEQQSMAKTKGVQLPKQPKKEHQSALKKLESTSGADFDRTYMQQMVRDHEKTLKLVRDAAKNAKDPEIKQAAEKAAPDVEEHLKMAKQIMEKEKSAK
jgi:putative membrane protein